MRFRKTVSVIELGLGVVAIVAALALSLQWLRIGQEADPHGIVVFTIFLMLGMGMLLLVCGLLLRNNVPWAIASQAILGFAVIFFYIEMFTPYAGLFF